MKGIARFIFYIIYIYISFPKCNQNWEKCNYCLTLIVKHKAQGHNSVWYPEVTHMVWIFLMFLSGQFNIVNKCYGSNLYDLLSK